jgi:hypothetical protein
MSTLVIHPQDASTDFLKPIYENIDCTLITGNCTKAEVYKQIEKHHRIIMLGHGSPQGLFAVNQFINEGKFSYIIDASFAKLLKTKSNNVYIWCDANQFVNKNKLTGFFTGMFISEFLEACMFEIYPEDDEIKKSNDLFARLVGTVIESEAEQIHKHIKQEYNVPDSRVCDFNKERIYWQ